jgi:hypothetical protein
MLDSMWAKNNFSFVLELYCGSANRAPLQLTRYSNNPSVASSPKKEHSRSSIDG